MYTSMVICVLLLRHVHHMHHVLTCVHAPFVDETRGLGIDRIDRLFGIGGGTDNLALQVAKNLAEGSDTSDNKLALVMSTVRWSFTSSIIKKCCLMRGKRH